MKMSNDASPSLEWPALANLAGLFDWETDADDRIIALSPLPSVMQGISTKDLLGRSLEGMLEPGGSTPDAWAHFKSDLAARRPLRDVVCRLALPTGEGRDLRLSGLAMTDPQGRFLGYRGLAIDVTSSLQTMNELRGARDAAIRESQAKTRLLATASHDLRQPLQALGLFVASLAEKSMPDAFRPLVERIQRSVTLLEELLDSLLDSARADTEGKGVASPSLPLQSLFDRLAGEIAPLAEQKGLSLRFVPTKARVPGPALPWERLLRNLLDNAVRYTDRGGIVVGCRRRGDSLHVEICDSGPGIPAAHQKDIFREFHRLGNDPEKLGHGLGLAIVQRLAALLGARIALRSTVGKGSVFSVICTAAPVDGTAVILKTEISHRQPRKDILS